MEILTKLPFDLQEHILVKVMKRYKLRVGKYVKQIDKTKYTFLDYIMRPIMRPIIQPPYYQALFYYKFYIKNLYDNPLRKESCVDDDMVYMRIYYKDNTYYYEISIYRLKMKNIDENNFTPEKFRKDIYHKGQLAHNYFWDFLEFSYEVK
jgi:hypothetical protein